jgi:hypothetical protein
MLPIVIKAGENMVSLKKPFLTRYIQPYTIHLILNKSRTLLFSMKGRYKISIKLVLLFFGLSSASLNAQMLKDIDALMLLKKDVDFIYSLQFDSAENISKKINKSFPGHPVTYLLSGMMNYWKNYPLIPSSATRSGFENDLRKCIELCEKKSDTSHTTEYLLGNLCARGLLLLFYSDNELSGDVFPLAISSYKYIRQAFSYPSSYSDFSFFTGQYNYYREAYPEIHPIYKPLAILFPKGNKALGLKELKEASEKSIFLKAESFTFLTFIYTGYENNFQEALNYIKSLHDLYPANPQYLAMYIKNLLLVKQYEEAESLIRSSGQQISNSYYQAQLDIFKGILQEKKYKDYKQALEYYNKGITGLSNYGCIGDEFAAYGYFGMSRISQFSGDQPNKKIYRKKAIDLAEFKNIDLDN